MSSTRKACSNALRATSRIAVPPALSRSCFTAVATLRVFRHASCTASTRSMAIATATRFYSTKSDGGYHEISATGSKLWNFGQMSELVKNRNGVVIIDSREPGELEQTGRIPTAINIPVATAPQSFHMSEEDFEDRYGYPRPDKEQELVIYCKAGVRSRALATLAKEAGWKNVGEYPGSWLDWEKNGGEIEKGGKGPGQE
ncbi:rhodanese-like domain-containing protein [Colletotrichum truncatum]|uniref:Rhodanese-like domain-containing protein n=1 Tax=Colletotrichum truncatum TaxID=5467 RepID=A0ACC3ZJX7_COLTU|nr:rhodanese-like domain-containing protein [Colletotrichum truncatum]KAF6782373.1 rhodanese-like domain-containing protein [Colletotrichum truncatum]